MLTHMEDRLSVVKRWGIVRTIQTQSVAEHSFRVALIAERIARQWFKAPPEACYYVLHFALRHDEKEAVSGDFPSIIKDLVNEDALDARYADQFISTIEVSDAVKKIVKLADKMEAMYFMVTEQALGNKTIDAVLHNLNVNTMRFLDESFPEAKDHFTEWANSNWAPTIVCDPLDRRYPEPAQEDLNGGSPTPTFADLLGGINAA